MREKIKLKREQGIELFDGGQFEDFILIEEAYEVTGKSRWSVMYNALVKNGVTGEMFLLPYQLGATEMQDEGLFEYMDPVLIPAQSVSVTIQKWIVDDRDNPSSEEQ